MSDCSIPTLLSPKMILFLKCQVLHQRKSNFVLTDSFSWLSKTSTQLSPVNLSMRSSGKSHASFNLCRRAFALVHSTIAWWLVSWSIPQMEHVAIWSIFLAHRRAWTPRVLEASFHPNIRAFGGTFAFQIIFHISLSPAWFLLIPIIFSLSLKSNASL